MLGNDDDQDPVEEIREMEEHAEARQDNAVETDDMKSSHYWLGKKRAFRDVLEVLEEE